MRSKKFSLRLLALVPILALLTMVVSPTTTVFATGTTIAQHIGIPAYFPPLSWEPWGPIGTSPQTYHTFDTAGGFAIANVINGPDYAADVNYDYSGTLAAEHNAGTKVIGYVDTGYFGTTGLKTRLGSTSTEAWRDQIEQDVNAWYSFYGSSVDGIFFDQAQNTCGTSNAYANLYAQVSQYVKDAHPGAFTVINPGTTVPSCYQNSADTIVTFEGAESSYTSTAVSLGWTPRDPNKIMHIIYGVPSGDLATVSANSKSWGAGYVDITDEGGTGNPPVYGSLPSYLSTEISDAAGSGDTTAPTAPDTVDTYDVQFTTAQLNWGASTDTGGSGVVGYDVYVKQGSGAYHWISSTPVDGYTIPDVYLTGLTPGATYTAYAVARDAAGNSSSNVNTATWTQDTDTDVSFPSHPNSPSASNTTYTSTQLSWSASTGGDYATSFYTVYQDGNRILQLPGNVLGATITGMTPGTSHSFVVYAVDEAGNVSSASSTVSVTTTSLPGGASITSPGGTYTTSTATLTANVLLPFSFLRVFIDSDNNASTGFTPYWLSPTIGADFMIENGRLYQKSGTDNGFSWTQIGTASPSISGNAYIWTVPTSTFGGGAASTIKVNFQAEGFNPFANSSVASIVRS